MLKNMKIGARLMMAFGCLIIGMVAAIGVGWAKLAAMDELVEAIVTKEWVKVGLTSEVKELAQDNAMATMELFLASDRQQIDRQLTRINANRDKVGAKINQIEALIRRPEG